MEAVFVRRQQEQALARIRNLFIDPPDLSDTRSVLNCLESLIAEHRSREATDKAGKPAAATGGAWSWQNDEDFATLHTSTEPSAAEQAELAQLRERIYEIDREIEHVQDELHLAQWEAGRGGGPDGGPSLDETVEFLGHLRKKIQLVAGPEDLDRDAQGKG